jgi:tripartite-type tricarboxylate transporter receptor subunit TctC
MKKKLVSLILAASIAAMSLAACGSTDSADQTTTSGTTEAASSSSSDSSSDASASDVDWPTTSVTVNVAAKAGGGTDLQTRYVTTAWQKLLPQAVAVVNYDNAQVAMETVRTAKADGYNLITNHSGCICQYFTGSSEINPAEDYQVIAAMQYMGDQAIIVAPDAPYDNMEEFIAYCKEHPGEVSCAIANGNSSHFIWGLIAQSAGVEFKMVEAANETEKLTNVAGGFISAGNVTLQNAIQYVDGGKVKVIGLISRDGVDDEDLVAERGEGWKTLQSQGVDAPWGSNLYIWAPKDLDRATAEAINASLKDVVLDEDYLAGCEAMGATPEWHDIDESQQMLEEETAIVKEVADALGINVR